MRPLEGWLLRYPSRGGVVFLALALTFAWATASAQSVAPTSGVVTLTGRVPQAVALQFHSDAVYGDGVVGRQQGGAPGTRLDYVLDLGEVVPTSDQQTSAYRGGTVVLILRSNTNYVLSATAAANGFMADPDYIQLTDIGFGIPAAEIRPSGELAEKRGTTVTSKIDFDPFSSPIRDGAPAFSATLGDLTNGTPLMNGAAISRRGSLTSPNNGLLVATKYALLPQMFREQPTFSATVTYTVATP